MTVADDAALVVSCPPSELLACFIDGRLTAAAVADLEEHLASCDRCCSIVAAVPELDDVVEISGGVTESAGVRIADAGPTDGRLGRYLLLERVGSGGMGVVWAAYDPELDRRVAIKLLHHDERGTAGVATRRRLVHEARAMARVSHPNIVAVHDVVEVDDRVFMIMELVAGCTLSAWLGERPRRWREIVARFVAAGRGLAAAHAQGVVHRDFKPDNVLVGEDGSVRVGDFGLASTDREPSTIAGSEPGVPAIVRVAAFAGTPAYMAPEQYACDSVDARTDQFAFCVALWEALYGARPFVGATVTALAGAVDRGEITPPSDRRGVPARIERALRRGLARDRAARHDDMLALLSELQAVIERRRVGVRLACAAVLVAGIGAFVVWPRADACATPPDWLASVWHASAREEVRRAAVARGEAATDLAARLTEILDARVSAMKDTFTGSCRAAFVDHTERAEDHDLRLACLRRGAAAIEVVIGFARDADEAGLARALRSVSGPSDLGDCADIERVRLDLPWMDGALDRGLATELSIAVRRATQLRRLGDFDGARELLARVLEVAGDPGLEAVVAAALLEQGNLDVRAGGDGRSLRDALATAIDAGSDAIAFDVLIELVIDEGARHNDLSAAQAHADLAMAFARRSGRADDGRGRVQVGLAQARERAGDLVGARAAMQRARTYIEAAGTMNEPRHFAMWIGSGLLDEQAGQLVAAEAQYDHAREMIEHAWGPFHPDVAIALEYLATVRRKAGAFDPSIEAAERALRIRRAVLGPFHPETAVSLAGLGNIRLEQGRYDDAEAAIDEALGIWRTIPGQERNVGLSLASLAEITLRRGDPCAARPLFRDALATSEAALGPTHPELVVALDGLGVSERKCGDPRAAVLVLERALALVESNEGDPIAHANVQLALAAALVDADVEPARATRLAASARQRAASVPEHAASRRLIAEIDALRLPP